MGRKLLSNMNAPIFSTTRCDNIPAIRALEKVGFEKVGNDYKSMRGNYYLQIMVYGM